MPVKWRTWEHFSKQPINPRTSHIMTNNNAMTATIADLEDNTTKTKPNFGEAATLELSGNFFREKSTSNASNLLESKAVARTLKVGSRGDDVKRLQENLNTLGYNTGKPDGIFGNGTKNAVVAFQKAKGLTADGIVGSGTQNAITRALNEKNAAANSNILKVGSKGAKVTQLQRNLNSLGYNAGTPDGAFGNGTKNAVVAFQKTYGLSADGVAGKSTQDAITTTINRKSKGILSKGQVSNDVKSLQSDLKTLGYLSSNPDGAFGTATETAVKAFQQRHKLTADGLVGADTRSQITAAVKAKTQPKDNGVLKLGSKGDKVKTLQSNLNSLGYDAGTPDGDFGNGTQTAVIKFQKTYGLTADGQAGESTQNAISKALNYKNHGVLSKGQVSDDVRNLQADLKTLGFLKGSQDGAFGTGTEEAVKAFQTSVGLKPDGQAGSSTRKALFDAAKNHKFIPSPEIPTGTSNEPINTNKKDHNRMIKKLENDKSLDLSDEKRTAMVTAAQIMLKDGYEVEFVAGMLGNIMAEGALGKFEGSNYKTNPDAKPLYLIDADKNFGYKNFSDKNIRDIGISKTMELENKMYNHGYETKGHAKFGLGMIQWTGSRTHDLLKLYKQECKGDKPTVEECAKVESMMISKELKGSHAYVYNDWKKTSKTAADAGRIIYDEYEIPSTDTKETRANYATSIYKILTE